MTLAPAIALIVFSPVIELLKFALFNPEKVSVSPVELVLNCSAPVVVDPAYSVRLFEIAVEVLAKTTAFVGELIVPEL